MENVREAIRRLGSRSAQTRRMDRGIGGGDGDRGCSRDSVSISQRRQRFCFPRYCHGRRRRGAAHGRLQSGLVRAPAPWPSSVAP